MSLKRKFFSVITLAFAVVAFSTFVSAQDSSQSDAPVKEGKSGKRGGYGKGMRGGKGMHGGGNVMRMLRGIELTEAQQTQIKSMMETQRATFEPRREEMKTLMMKKRDGSLTESDQVRLDQFKSEMKASSEQMRLSVLALLTPEQTTKLNQLQAEREQRRQERKQKWQEQRQQTEKPTDN